MNNKIADEIKKLDARSFTIGAILLQIPSIIVLPDKVINKLVALLTFDLSILAYVLLKYEQKDKN